MCCFIQVVEVDAEETSIKCMKKASGDLFIWPDKDDTAWVSVDQIVCMLRPPELVNKRGKFLFKDLIDYARKGLCSAKIAIHFK